MASPFALISIVAVLGALFSLLSVRVLRLPNTIGTMVLALLCAACLIVIGQHQPALHAFASRVVEGIDFGDLVLHDLLALLLFAGAMQLNMEQLLRHRTSVLLLSVLTTVLSTAVVAVLFFGLLHLVGVPCSALAALLFGALISPTDPIAVLDMLRRACAPPELEIHLAGESLFNDGVGAVIFLALLTASSQGQFPSVQQFLALLAVRAGGGLLLGLVLGYITYRLLRLVDNYRVEIMLTLALALGGYALADFLNISAPLEAVAAGIVVSGRARELAMSAVTREHLNDFWELIDDFLNVALFLMLGLQLVVVPFSKVFLVAGLLAIPTVLVARFVSVAAVVQSLQTPRNRLPCNLAVLTWGGLRGGLAVALALSLPQTAAGARNMLLVATMVVVVFSIVVQGLTLPRLLSRCRL